MTDTTAAMSEIIVPERVEKTQPSFTQKARNWGPQFKYAMIRGSEYVLMLLGVLFAVLTFYKAADGPQILLTKTPSLNPGWYLLDPVQPLVLQRGEIVRWNFVPPQWLREWHPELPAKAYLKRVVGLPGDRIYWEENRLMVCPPKDNCSNVGKAAPHDGTGHPFPRSVFPEVIPADQYLLVADHPLSIDSRYLGLIPINAVTGRAREWKTETRDYVKLNAEAEAWFASHRTEDFKDGVFVGKLPAEKITVPGTKAP